MNSDFAGSSSHDDRRRRRLLSEHSVSDENAAVVFMSGQIESSRNHRYPVKRIIHYRAWKIWVISLVLMIFGGGMLYGSWTAQHRDLGTGFSSVFDAETGHIFPVIGAGLLFLSGQLSWLIGWARSRSLTDYSGTFRVWKYIGLFLFVASFGVLIGADRVLKESLEFAGVHMPWNIPEWNWILPVGAVSLILLWYSDREMRVSKLGRAYLWCAVALLVGGVGLPLVPQFTLPVLVSKGLVLGGLIGLLTSLMWFARHVLYFSAEPAAQAKRSGFWSKFLDHWKQRRIQQKASAQEKKAAQRARAAEKKASVSPASEPQSGSKRRRGFRKKTETALQNTPVTVVEDTSDSADEFPENPNAQIVKLDPSDLCVSEFDEALLKERIEMMELLAAEGEQFDLELLKGLTKKQKKRLRNYWRELERYHQLRRAG